jgi:hypothetical protein
MINIQPLRDDDCVGTLRRRIKRAVLKQLPPGIRETAYEAAKQIVGGIPSDFAPPGVVTVPFKPGCFVIPVDKEGRAFSLTGFADQVMHEPRRARDPSVTTWHAWRDALAAARA